MRLQMCNQTGFNGWTSVSDGILEDQKWYNLTILNAPTHKASSKPHENSSCGKLSDMCTFVERYLMLNNAVG